MSHSLACYGSICGQTGGGAIGMVSLLLTVLVDKYHVRCLKIYKLYVHADWCKRKKTMKLTRLVALTAAIVNHHVT